MDGLSLAGFKIFRTRLRAGILQSGITKVIEYYLSRSNYASSESSDPTREAE